MKLIDNNTNISYRCHNCRNSYLIEHTPTHNAALRYDDLLGMFYVLCYGCHARINVPEELLLQLTPHCVYHQYTTLKQQFPNTTPTKTHFMFTEETNNETI